MKPVLMVQLAVSRLMSRLALARRATLMSRISRMMFLGASGCTAVTMRSHSMVAMISIQNQNEM